LEKGWGVEYANIGKAERLRCVAYTDLSPDSGFMGEICRVAAVAEITVHEHDDIVLIEFTRRVVSILPWSLRKHPATALIAFVNLKGDLDR
jgi:hypothetical protein